jgi:hypothetical protein
MHALLSRQLERYCPASGDTDLPGLSTAGDGSDGSDGSDGRQCAA